MEEVANRYRNVDAEAIGSAATWLLLGFAALIGIAACFKGLVGPGLAIDEFHSVMAVEYVLERGVPQFESGGYYDRGVLLTYLGAVIAWVTGVESLTALRLVAVVSGLLTLPPIYLLVKDLWSSSSARVAVAILLLSVLETETARYARMYAPYIAIFTWYVWHLGCVLRHPDPNRHLGWMLGICLVGAFIYEGAILLALLNIVPLLLPHRRVPFWFFAGSAGMILVVLCAYFVDWRSLGTDRFGSLPSTPGQGPAGRAGWGPILTPATFPGAAWQYSLTSLISLAGGVALALRLARHSVPLALGTSAALMALAVHQFVLAAGLAGVSALFASHVIRDIRATTWLLFCTVALALAASWMFFLSTHLGTEWSDALKSVHRMFFDYPDVIRAVVWPWLSLMPAGATLLLGAVIAGVVVSLKNQRHPGDCWHVYVVVAGVCLAMVFLVAALRTPYLHVRYSQFLYPTAVALAVVGFQASVRELLPFARLHAAAGLKVAVSTVGTAVLLLLSEDVSLTYLRNIDSYEYAYRLNPATEHQRARLDYRSPAEFIDMLDEDALVISTLRQVAYYTNGIDYVYIPNESPEYHVSVADEGRREIWTNLPLLSTVEEMDRLIDAADRPVYGMFRGGAYPFMSAGERFLEGHAGLLEYTAPDGRIRVKRLE